MEMKNYEYDSNINCVRFVKHLQQSWSRVMNPSKDRLIDSPVLSAEEMWLEKDSVNRDVEEVPMAVFPLAAQTSESQFAHSKSSKHFTSFKHKTKFNKAVVTHNYEVKESFSVLKYCKHYSSNILSILLKILKFIMIYGTELIVQILAITTLLFVMLLKLIDSFVRNQYLSVFISYVEKIDFSNFSFPIFSIDFLKIFKGIKSIFWIIKMLLEFLIIIMKHFLIQSFIGIFVLLSWLVFYAGAFVGHFIFLPAVNKTMNILHMDGDTVSLITRIQLEKGLSHIVVSSYTIAPLASNILMYISNVRNNIAKVNLIKEIVMNSIVAVKSLIKSIINIIRDISGICRLFLDLHNTFLGIIVLLSNTLSLIGFMIFIIFQMLNQVGYALSIFITGFSAGSKALSRLKKI